MVPRLMYSTVTVKKNTYKKSFIKVAQEPVTSPFLNPASGSKDQFPYSSQTNNFVQNSYSKFRSNYFPGAGSSNTSRPWPSTSQNSTRRVDNNNW